MFVKDSLQISLPGCERHGLETRFTKILSWVRRNTRRRSRCVCSRDVAPEGCVDGFDTCIPRDMWHYVSCHIPSGCEAWGGSSNSIPWNISDTRTFQPENWSSTSPFCVLVLEQKITTINKNTKHPKHQNQTNLKISKTNIMRKQKQLK